jgi:hypothetical protein
MPPCFLSPSARRPVPLPNKAGSRGRRGFAVSWYVVLRPLMDIWTVTVSHLVVMARGVQGQLGDSEMRVLFWSLQCRRILRHETSSSGIHLPTVFSLGSKFYSWAAMTSQSQSLSRPSVSRICFQAHNSDFAFWALGASVRRAQGVG